MSCLWTYVGLGLSKDMVKNSKSIMNGIILIIRFYFDVKLDFGFKFYSCKIFIFAFINFL